VPDNDRAAESAAGQPTLAEQDPSAADYLKPLLTTDITPFIQAAAPDLARHALRSVNDTLQDLLDGSDGALASAPKHFDPASYADQSLLRALQVDNMALKNIIVRLRYAMAIALEIVPDDDDNNGDGDRAEQAPASHNGPGSTPVPRH